MDERIVWMPSLGHHNSGAGFSITLDREFARKMVGAKRVPGLEERLDEIAKRTLKILDKFSGFVWNGLSPYTFYRETGLISNINIQTDCVCVGIRDLDAEDLLKNENGNPLTYFSHNVDKHMQAYALLRMFDKWIYFSDSLIGE